MKSRFTELLNWEPERGIAEPFKWDHPASTAPNGYNVVAVAENTDNPSELLMPKTGAKVHMTEDGKVHNSDTRLTGLSNEVRCSMMGSRAARGMFFVTLDDELSLLLAEDAYRGQEGE